MITFNNETLASLGKNTLPVLVSPLVYFTLLRYKAAENNLWKICLPVSACLGVVVLRCSLADFSTASKKLLFNVK